MIGRNYCYQTGGGGAQLIFDDKHFNPFIGAGALSMATHDYNGDAFDHSDLDFVGGVTIGSGESNGRPIDNRPTHRAHRVGAPSGRRRRLKLMAV